MPKLFGLFGPEPPHSTTYMHPRIGEVILSKQCLRLGSFIIIMQKAWFEIYLRFIRNQAYRSFFILVYLMCSTGVSFFTSNRICIRVEFKFNWYLVSLFIVAMEISISLKIYHIKLQSNSNIWCKFHIDPSPGSLLNGQMKMFGLVWYVERHLNNFAS